MRSISADSVRRFCRETVTAVASAEHLDDATRRMSVVIEQGQKAGEIKADIPPMDLARFLLNSLYGAILVSKAETTDRPMRLFLRLAFEPLLLQRRKA